MIGGKRLFYYPQENSPPPALPRICYSSARASSNHQLLALGSRSIFAQLRREIDAHLWGRIKLRALGC